MNIQVLNDLNFFNILSLLSTASAFFALYYGAKKKLQQVKMLGILFFLAAIGLIVYSSLGL
jgi:hypothetical protein